jgi:hypothetical protein
VVVKRPRLERREPNRILMDVDYYLSDQYIAFVDPETENAANGDSITAMLKRRSFAEI